MTHLEKIPIAGDYFEWNGYRFEVVDMDMRRVDKILVTPLAKDKDSRKIVEKAPCKSSFPLERLLR